MGFLEAFFRPIIATEKSSARAPQSSARPGANRPAQQHVDQPKSKKGGGGRNGKGGGIRQWCDQRSKATCWPTKSQTGGRARGQNGARGGVLIPCIAVVVLP